MGSTADKLTYLNETKRQIKDAIAAKGVAVPDGTPFRQYPGKIAAIQGEGGEATPPADGGWVRPADRPPVPTLNENKIYMLFGVQPTGPNDYAITLSGASYVAEWGDGTTDSYASGKKAEHMFDYAAVNVTPNADGIKWVWMKFYATSGNFTQIDTNVRHNSRPAASNLCIFVPQVYEMYIKAAQVGTWAWGTSTRTRYMRLEKLEYQGVNRITSFSYFLYYSHALRSLSIDTSKGKDFSSFLFYCSSFNQSLNIDTSQGTSFNNFLYYCYSFNQPLSIDTSQGTSFSNFLSSCASFNQSLNIDTSQGTNFSNFLSYCSSFNQSLNINTSKGANLNNFLYTCRSFNGQINIDLLSATTAIGTGFIGTSCYTLTGLRLRNMGSIHTALTISYSNLDVEALTLLFGDLYDRSSTTAGKITITGCYGAAHLTAAQRAIATNKNWTIVG